MIYSVSKYTDVPYYFMDQFIELVENGGFEYDLEHDDDKGKKTTQSHFFSLEPSDVTGIVLWSKCWDNYIQHMDHLESKYRIVYNHSAPLLPHSISNSPFYSSVEEEVTGLVDAISTFGPERVTWHLKPLMFTNVTPIEYWMDILSDTFQKINKLTGGEYVDVAFEFYQPTQYSERRMMPIYQNGVLGLQVTDKDIMSTIHQIFEMGKKYRINFQSCQNPYLVVDRAMERASCVNPRKFKVAYDVLSRHLTPKNAKKGLSLYPDDPQDVKSPCACAKHIDIGFLFDNCPGGCSYCSERLLGE